MWYWPRNSTILIFIFGMALIMLNLKSLSIHEEHDWGSDKKSRLKKIPTIITGLDYFNTKNHLPVLSLRAQEMESLDNEFASFVNPNGTYITKDSREPVNYQARKAEYDAKTSILKLLQQAKLDFQKSKYEAERIVYDLKNEIVDGSGEVILDAFVEKSAQKIHIEAPHMRSWTKQKKSYFNPEVKGSITMLKRPGPPIHFSSLELTLNTLEEHINLLNNVKIKKGEVDLSSRKADIYMENQNKKLKYFVLNDDVKMTEKFVTKSGEPVERRAFGERLEGFGSDESFLLTGAPRVEQGKDVLKGYKIIIREKLEFIEVEDAMSDIETKKEKEKEKEKK